jgi:cytochrome c oxidase subunit II
MRTSGPLGRIVVAWLVVSTVGMVLVATVLAPHLPPGNGSTEASGQQFDNEMLTLVSVPIVALVLVYLGYVLVAFRERDPSKLTDGPPIRGHMRLQTGWVVVTTVTVLFLAAFGTYELLDGAGGGQGSNPVFLPNAQAASAAVITHSTSPLQVQVIAQQWQFTYRYPDNGGFETAHLVLPVGQQVELHVTSLDVIHSFWALKLGVKADANPGVDNVAYVTPTKVGSFDIHCAELCGLFHGYMFDTGQVMSAAGFSAWVKQQQAFMAPIATYLPAYGHVYLPDPQIRGG